jgi:hypothetical protein
MAKQNQLEGKIYQKIPLVWVQLDLLTRKIKLRCIKSTGLGTLPLEMAKIRSRIKQPDLDPYQVEKQDPDQSEKQDPD